MQIDQAKLELLADSLAHHRQGSGSFNFLPVVVRPGDAAAVGRFLAEKLEARFIDLDAEVISQLEAFGWERCVTFERAGMKSVLQVQLRAAVAAIGGLVSPERPVVVANANLPASFDYPEVANELYQLSNRGLIVFCVGGSLHGDRVLLHHTLHLTGGGLVTPVDLTA